MNSPDTESSRIYKIEFYPTCHPSLTSCFKYLQSMPRVQESLTPSPSLLSVSPVLFRSSIRLFILPSLVASIFLSSIPSLSATLYFSLVFLSLSLSLPLFTSLYSLIDSSCNHWFSTLPLDRHPALSLSRAACSPVDCSSLLLDFGKAVSPLTSRPTYFKLEMCATISQSAFQKLATKKLQTFRAINIRTCI